MDPYDRILVATDGSPGSRPVLEHGVMLAGLADASIHALYVVDQRFPSAAENDIVVERMEEQATEALDAVETAAEPHGIDVTKRLRRGIPHEEIVAYADQYDIDVIVLGTHGRSQIGRFIHAGSVTERVVRTAEVPVFVTRIRPEDDPAAIDERQSVLPGVELSGGE
ncbi:MAG: universal stress protein [Halobacteriota archaeon]